MNVPKLAEKSVNQKAWPPCIAPHHLARKLAKSGNYVAADAIIANPYASTCKNIWPCILTRKHRKEHGQNEYFAVCIFA